jgi:hypothetical protein
VAIRVIVEFQARPGARAELASVLDDIMATLGSGIPGFLGAPSTRCSTAQMPSSRLPSGTPRMQGRLPCDTRRNQGSTALSQALDHTTPKSSVSVSAPAS